MSSHTIRVAYEDIDGPGEIEVSYLGGGDLLLIQDSMQGMQMAYSREAGLALIQALADLAAVRAELRSA